MWVYIGKSLWRVIKKTAILTGETQHLTKPECFSGSKGHLVVWCCMNILMGIELMLQWVRHMAGVSAQGGKRKNEAGLMNSAILWVQLRGDESRAKLLYKVGVYYVGKTRQTQQFITQMFPEASAKAVSVQWKRCKEWMGAEQDTAVLFAGEHSSLLCPKCCTCICLQAPEKAANVSLPRNVYVTAVLSERELVMGLETELQFPSSLSLLRERLKPVWEEWTSFRYWLLLQ